MLTPFRSTPSSFKDYLNAGYKLSELKKMGYAVEASSPEKQAAIASSGFAFVPGDAQTLAGEYEGLFNCCNDCCLCWAVFACPCVTAPQLHERISGEPGSCTKWTIILASLVVTAQILSSVSFRLGPLPTLSQLRNFCRVASVLRHHAL